MNKVKIGPYSVGRGEKFLLIGGPCVAESKEICFEIAAFLKELCASLGVNYVFKASFDKANRSSGKSFRGNGMEYGLEITSEIGKGTLVKILLPVRNGENYVESNDC